MITDPAPPAAPRPAAGATRFDPRVYRDPAPLPWLIRALGPVVRHGVLPGWLKLRPIDFPAADLARLCAAVNRRTAAFVAPNHPEFMTDWMIDKELSRRCSPLMAHWAAYEIVNQTPLAQRFWLANHRIANAPGGGGREYSIRWALAGHGVLLHPEGTATWQADRIGPLVPGAVAMAWEAFARAHAAGVARATYVVPVVWRLHFTRDVGAALDREMALIERDVRLPPAPERAVERRFAALLWNVLRARAARFEIAMPAERRDGGTAFFDAQERCAEALLERLYARHGRPDGDRLRVVFALRKAVRAAADTDPARAREERAMLQEVERLGRFDRALYAGPTLTQEQIAETLQQTRSSLMTRGFRNAMHNLVPVAVAARALRIRVPEPLAIADAFSADPAEAGRRIDALLAELRARLQRGVDGLAKEIASQVDPHRRTNPFHG